jgi:hypothetical protein
MNIIRAWTYYAEKKQTFLLSFMLDILSLGAPYVARNPL